MNALIERLLMRPNGQLYRHMLLNMLNRDENQRWNLKRVADYFCSEVLAVEKQELGYTGSKEWMRELENPISPGVFQMHPNRG